MAAKNCVICMIRAMDRLWFHQIILFSEPSLFQVPKNQEQESSDLSSKNSPEILSVPSLRETSLVAPAITAPQNEASSQESDDAGKETAHHEDLKPRRLSPVLKGKSRSHSSSPISTQKRSRNNLPRLLKTMSCKSLADLELEELKGFMDLGFIFRKENLSKRVINLIPGLQRIDDSYKHDENHDDKDEDEDEEKNGVTRPYLSEAWTIKRPDSPLLNLRIPRVSTAADMKKHLMYWAQTVASAIRQES